MQFGVKLILRLSILAGICCDYGYFINFAPYSFHKTLENEIITQNTCYAAFNERLEFVSTKQPGNGAH